MDPLSLRVPLEIGQSAIEVGAKPALLPGRQAQQWFRLDLRLDILVLRSIGIRDRGGRSMGRWDETPRHALG
jgi:hypothetical protein